MTIDRSLGRFSNDEKICMNGSEVCVCVCICACAYVCVCEGKECHHEQKTSLHSLSLVLVLPIHLFCAIYFSPSMVCVFPDPVCP